MDKETADATRGMVRRATVKKINDDGEMQTASVEVADGIVREDIEVLQPFGQVSHATADGGLVILLAVGGDQGDLVALPVGNPSTRMGKVAPGTIGHANASGDKILIHPNGTIELASAGSIVAKVGGVTLTLSAGGIAIEGGTVTHNGKNIGSDHVHTGVIPGGGNTGVPA